MRFQVFSFASKTVQGFSSDRKILMLLLSVLFYLLNSCVFFEILVFSQDIWGNVHYVAENKSVLSPKQNSLKEIGDMVL